MASSNPILFDPPPTGEGSIMSEAIAAVATPTPAITLDPIEPEKPLCERATEQNLFASNPFDTV
jgi:hypothetical protein